MAASLTIARGRSIRLARSQIVIGLMLIAVAIPIALVPIPPLLDYPNHLSRYWLLGRFAAGHASPFYAPHWDTITKIAADLAATAAADRLPITLLGSLMLFLGATLPALGALRLNSSLFEGDDWWLAVFPLIAWNTILLAGFLNFEIGVGLALLAASAERGRPTWQKLLIRAACAGPLLLAHLFALGFYALLAAGLDFGEGLPRSPGRFGAAARRVALGAMPAILALAAYALLSPTVVGAGSHESLGQWAHDLLALYPRKKASSALMLVSGYSTPFDILCAAILGGLAITVALRGARLHAGLFLAALLLGLLFVATPDRLASTGWIDRRFALLAPITLLVSLRPRFTPRMGAVFFGVLLALFLVRSALVTGVWIAREQDVRALQAATARIPAGSAILPLEHTTRREDEPIGRVFAYATPTYWHMATLPVIWRGAFVPTLFAARGEQPIEVRGRWAALASEPTNLTSAHVIVDPPRDLPRYLDYVRRWRAYDYVLVLNADVPDEAGPTRFPACFARAADTGFAVVWDIRGCRGDDDFRPRRAAAAG